MVSKPHLNAWQICKICIGAFGLQFGFALPQANATRIFQNLGASLDSVPLLWLAGPITGLIVQPLVGYYSDRTWTRFGRRRPYFLAGAVLAASAMIAMPNATTLWTAMFMLWLLDASVNFTMGPYRAFVADEMSAEQRSTGYLMYMFFASIGAVVGSLLPWAMAHLGFSSLAPAGVISESVKIAFYVGATLLVAALCWSAFTNREYPPEVMEAFEDAAPDRAADRSTARMRRHAFVWLAAGITGLADRVAVGRAARALRAGRRRDRVRRVAVRGQPIRSAQCLHEHHRRSRDHVGLDALARAGAVLLVVLAVRDLRVHRAGGGETAFRRHGPGLAGLRGRRQLGRRVVRDVQRARRR